MENNADNLWVLLSLQDQDEISEGAIKRYLESNEGITKEILIPPVKEMKDAYEGFEKLDYAVEDAGLIIGLVTGQAEKNFGEFVKEIDVRLDETWKEMAKELRETVLSAA